MLATQFLQRLHRQDAVLVTVQSRRGSAPREAGAWMAVFEDVSLGTIGGGQLEWQALQYARQVLDGASLPAIQRLSLGPALQQCCGGEVHLHYRRVQAGDGAELGRWLQTQRGAWPTVAVFGAGHVGQALIRLLHTLPLQLRWIDSREAVFPADAQAGLAGAPAATLQCLTRPVMPDEVQRLPAGALALIMSFSHALDLDLVAACLQRQRQRPDLNFIGLIGSRSKWASFGRRLRAQGFTEAELAQVHCPVGLPGITGKQPEVIAVAIAAQVLQVVSLRSMN